MLTTWASTRTAIALLICVLAACGSANSSKDTPRTPKPSPSLSPLQQAYVRPADVLNGVLKNTGLRLKSDAQDLPALSSNINVEVAAFQTFDKAIASYAWPADLQSHIQTLLGADQVVRDALARQAAESSLFDMRVDQSSVDAAITADDVAVARIRSDLGLPPRGLLSP